MKHPNLQTSSKKNTRKGSSLVRLVAMKILPKTAQDTGSRGLEDIMKKLSRPMALLLQGLTPSC
jgi:hypothetical protein